MKNKNNFILVLTITVLIIVDILLLFINNTQNTTYKVTFDSGQLFFVDVLPNEKVEKPPNPIKDNLEFIGWYYNNKLFDFDNPCNENIYLKAYYLSSDGNIVDGNGNINNSIYISNKINPNQDEQLYTVKFFYDNSKIEPFATYQIKSGEKIGNIILEDEIDRKFEGWFIGEEKFDFDKEINSNIFLYGKWSDLKYLVFFYSNGGNSIANQEVLYDSIPKNVTPSKTGYTFAGWLYDGKIYNFNYPFNKNVTLTAIWVKNSNPTTNKEKYYTVSFNSNGGNSIANQEILYDSIPKNVIPSKTGYTFDGWLYDGKIYNFNYSFNKNVTLTASWIKNIVEEKYYTVIFNSNGGNGIPNQKVLYDNIPINVIPSKTGYTFDGWLYDGKIYNFNYAFNQDITLTANWTKNVVEEKYYTVIFNSNGGNSIANQKVLYDSIPKKVIPSKTGYTFDGWLYDGKIYNFNYAFNKDITLTASWTKNVVEEKYYTVTFNSNGGNSIESVKVLKGNSLTSLPTVSKNNYVFDGWYTYSKEKFDINTKINDNITLYANWIPTIKYTYNNNGKFFFINNPELLMDKFAADSNNKAALYRDEFSGNAEFYYEHTIHYGYSYYYAIKVFNPNKNTVTLTFNNCAADSLNKNENPAKDLLSQYYGNCLINQKSITLGYGETAYIYANPKSNSYKYYASKDTNNVSNSVSKVSGNIEGFMKMNSSGNLIFAVIIFNDIKNSSDTIYNGNIVDITTDDFGTKWLNSAVYSGKLNTLNVTNLDFTYDIYDITPKGNLLVNYKDANNKSQTLDYWVTNYRGNVYNALPAIGSDYAKLIVPVDSVSRITIGPYPIYKEERNIFSLNNISLKGTAYNWANWGIHYDEKIKIYNHTNTQKSVTYRISYENCNSTNRYGIYYNNQLYALGYNNTQKDITVDIAAGKSVTINPISTLTGFSCEYSKKQLILNN